ncbi:MAG: hypothetical protein M1820_006116 [Bogoriella megaspora]|nr:MAG: hypothetical protein M1820_006116 [Bogoriella megaspora]
MVTSPIDCLPAEIILHIASFLDPTDLVRCQSVSRNFWILTRDKKLWKTICFENSRAEALRRRQELMSPQHQQLVALRQAIASLPGGNGSVHDEEAPSAEMAAHSIASRERSRALANWDPSYPDEKVDFYQEYIQRHAPITMNWLQTMTDGTGEGKEMREATGVGILRDEGEDGAERAIAPLDDGSIGIWDITPWLGRGPKHQGRLIGRSAANLLSSPPPSLDKDAAREHSKTVMTETGAVECVSIDGVQRKGHLAVQNTLNEVDLNTLQVVSRHRFPFPITALSASEPSTPLTVGTNMTIHLHDPRQSPPSAATDSPASSLPNLTARCELIAGSSPPRLSPFSLQPPTSGARPFLPISALTGTHLPSPTHATLSQPGPLSILHLPPSLPYTGNASIWVAGRFTSLLNYSRRQFPKLHGTLHSGARLSSLTLLPHPFIPREMDLMRDARLSIADIDAAKRIPGVTMVAAGEYKGKGSLELYGLSPEPEYGNIAQGAGFDNGNGRGIGGVGNRYQNRQTASASKLLAVAPQGTRVVVADGDGGVKWVERDGWSVVRNWNVNEAGVGNRGTRRGEGGDSGYSSGTDGGLGEGGEERVERNDIVQKMVPTTSPGVNNENLLLWTGDGRLGLLGFGRRPLFEEADWAEDDGLSEEARREEQRAREYAGRMRRALERQADEVRWVRGMGLPGLRP